MPTSPQTRWEELVTRAQQSCNATFGDGKDADGNGKYIYTHQGGTPFPVDGIFEAASEQLDPETGFNIISNQPKLTVALADLQQIPDQGDSVVIRGKTYIVVEPAFDGQGTVELRLHEQ